jgi:hypothetical protein
MRELFKTPSFDMYRKTIRDDDGSMIDYRLKITSLLRFPPETVMSCGNGWIDAKTDEGIADQLEELSEKIDMFRYEGYRGKAETLEEVERELANYGAKLQRPGHRLASRCYVPMMRGMRPPMTLDMSGELNSGIKDWYKLRTQHDYFVNSGDVEIFTGLGLFSDLRQRLLARTQEIRDTVRDYENFLSKNFFDGQEVTLIPVEEDNNDVVYIKIGTNQEYPVYDLGDGMQSLIICTYPIVTETKPGSLFFLEEPDLCMHPSLQRTFLEVLKTYHRVKGHQFFLTTHSNHLLDLLEDNELVNIFSFSQIESGSLLDSSQSTSNTALNSTPTAPRFRIRASNLRDRQTLLELGVRPSATFLANATIWVEGISDCAYLRAYMEAFVRYLQIRGDEDFKGLAAQLDRYKEDRHYAFVEYSGGNLTHFRFSTEATEEGQDQANGDRVTSVPDLCATAIVLADGDVQKKADRESVFVMQLKERFIVLPCKEIENMIPAAPMKEQIRNDHTPPNRGILDQNKLESIGYDTYARSEEGIGRYLGETVGIKKYHGTPGNGGGSGTLPTTYKTRWRSETKGIPALVRDAFNQVSTSAQQGQRPESENLAKVSESGPIPQLPDYLTQDLVWLCICLYAHIAKCNHDTTVKEKLQRLQEFILHSADVFHPPGNSADAGESNVHPWPIMDATDRTCLLSRYLYSIDCPELSQPTVPAAIPLPASTSPT